jgi:hypothetical protein
MIIFNSGVILKLFHMDQLKQLHRGHFLEPVVGNKRDGINRLVTFET